MDFIIGIMLYSLIYMSNLLTSCSNNFHRQEVYKKIISALKEPLRSFLTSCRPVTSCRIRSDLYEKVTCEIREWKGGGTELSAGAPWEWAAVDR
jgi:hypothetical protein